MTDALTDPMTVDPSGPHGPSGPSGPGGAGRSERDPDGREEVVDWAHLGQRMWDFLSGRQAAIHYTFEDMAVEVPRDTGTQSPRATWKLNGTLTITTTDHATQG